MATSRHPNRRHGSSSRTGHVLHVYEEAAAQIFTDPHDLTAVHWVPRAMQHIELRLPDEATGQALRVAPPGVGVQTSQIMDLQLNRSIRLLDNMGLRTDVAWRRQTQSPPARLKQLKLRQNSRQNASCSCAPSVQRVYLALAHLAYTDRARHCLADDPVVQPYLELRSVEPQVGMGALRRRLPKLL
jgi:hypothetical protein